MNKKIIRNQSHISMDKFLRDYCYIGNEYLIEVISSLSHREMKRVCMEAYDIKLVTLPFELVTSEDVKRGDVVLVIDTFNNCAPYKNPKKIDLLEIMSENSRLKQNSYKMNFDEMIDSVESSLVNEKVKRIRFF